MAGRSSIADHVRRSLCRLWPDAPSARLAGIAGRPKSTARSWRSARRRAPARVLSLVRTELQSRSAEIFSLLREFDVEIARREGEPPPRRGFFVVGPARTGKTTSGEGRRQSKRQRGGEVSGRFEVGLRGGAATARADGDFLLQARCTARTRELGGCSSRITASVQPEARYLTSQRR